MSNGNAALALALGAGAGLGLWYLTRDDEEHDAGVWADPPVAPAAPAATTTAASVPAPCALRLAVDGLTADGVRVDVATAVARCQSAGAAELALADDAPTAVVLELAAALQRAGITLRLAPRRNGRGPRARSPRFTRDGRKILRDGEPVLQLDRIDLGDQRFAITPHEADLLAERVVDLLNGAGRPRRQSAETTEPARHRIFIFRTYPANGNSRTRFYEADPPTTWEDAKRRLVAAGLLDERITLPTEWKLVADPPLRVLPHRLRPLP